jgi:hypothetical protein
MHRQMRNRSKTGIAVKNLGSRVMDLERPVNTDPRRWLPSVDRLTQQAAGLASELPLWSIRSAARTCLQALREEATAGDAVGREADGGFGAVARSGADAQ